MQFSPGEDVIVSFEGADWPGEVERVANGWVTARIMIDPEWDFGGLSPNISPIMTVAVREKFVKPRVHDPDDADLNYLFGHMHVRNDNPKGE